MKVGQPSRTALGAAVLRAAHQSLEEGRIFNDPFACRLLGANAGELIAAASADPSQTRMRLFMAARSRFAEDSLASAVSRGIRQVAVVGAGLDTFSLRNPFASQGVRVFELDHPASQAWKRDCLAKAGIEPPSTLVFAPIDFEQHSVAEGLELAGFRMQEPAFYMWLGVVPYLRQTTIANCLKCFANVADSEVVFDYAEPLENYSAERRVALEALAAKTASLGEPWLSFFEPVTLEGMLRSYGFQEFEHLAIEDIGPRYLGAPPFAGTYAPGPRIVRAHKIT